MQEHHHPLVKEVDTRVLELCEEGQWLNIMSAILRLQQLPFSE